MRWSFLFKFYLTPLEFKTLEGAFYQVFLFQECKIKTPLLLIKWSSLHQKHYHPGCHHSGQGTKGHVWWTGGLESRKNTRYLILSSGSHLWEETCYSESGLTAFPNTVVTKNCISGEKNNLHAGWNIIVPSLDYQVTGTEITPRF